MLSVGVGNLGVYIVRAQKQPETVQKQSEAAQKQAEPAQKQAPKPDFLLRVTTRDLIGISLKAEKAPLSKIASEMSKKLKIPVMLGKAVQEREVTADFKGLTLEPAMHQLAPAVYIDYEINRSPGAQPQPIGIYLYGYEDPAPPINAVVPSTSEAILIEGNTEDGVEGSQTAEKPEEQPLQVTYESNVLTVKAKKQVLSIVLYKIANELGIPFEMRSDSTEVVDLDINKMPVEDAFLRLSPQVRLYVRADLQRMERRPFRMVLVAPNKG